MLNPVAVETGGLTLLFYRAVALDPPNYSRILIASCQRLPTGNIEVTRLHKVALEPEAAYERWADGN